MTIVLEISEHIPFYFQFIIEDDNDIYSKIGAIIVNTPAEVFEGLTSHSTTVTSTIVWKKNKYAPMYLS